MDHVAVLSWDACVRRRNARDGEASAENPGVLLLFSVAILPPGHDRQRFEKGDTVALRSARHKHVPSESYGQPFFCVLSLPDSIFFFKEEPRWASLQACDSEGKLLRGHKPFDAGLTWLDGRLRIAQDAEPERRQQKLVNYLLRKVNSANCGLRLKVRRHTPCVLLVIVVLTVVSSRQPESAVAKAAQSVPCKGCVGTGG